MPFKKKELAENERRRRERDRIYRQYGYDSERAARFVLSKAGSLKERVLDVGTGKGRFVVQLAKRAKQVVTVDERDSEQRYARMNALSAGVADRIRFVVADAADLSFRDRSFDAVVSMHALHHIHDLDGVLTELARVLRPGGKMVLADFSASGFRIFDRIHRAEGRVHEKMPYRWSSLIARLRRMGFAVRDYCGEHTRVMVGVLRETS